MNKTNKIFNKVICENINDNSNIKYYISGSDKLYKDDFNEGESDIIQENIYQSVTQPTLTNAFITFMSINDIKVNIIKNYDEIDEIPEHGMTKIYVSYYVDNNDQFVQLDENSQIFDDWKNNKIDLFIHEIELTIYQIKRESISVNDIKGILKNG